MRGKFTTLIVFGIFLAFIFSGAFAVSIDYYVLKITVRDTHDRAVTADSIKIYYTNGVLAANKDGTDAVCYNKHECTFSLAADTYIVGVIAKSFIPKNATLDLQSNGTSRVITVKADTIPPTTTISLTPQPNDAGWYNQNVRVTLSAADNKGGAGVKEIRYCINNLNLCSPSKRYTSPFDISNEGAWYVRFRSEDYAQNVEDVKYQIVRLDKSKPLVSVIGAPVKWQNKVAKADISCTDMYSGCDTESYRLYVSSTPIASCPADYSLYTQKVPYEVSKHTWICAAVKDIADNVGFSAPVEFLVDLQAPRWSGMKATPSNPVYSPGASYKFEISWTDNEIMDDVIFEFNGKNYSYANNQISKSGSIYSITFKDLAAGQYNYKWYAVDKAKNWASTQVQTYTITKAAVDVKLYLNDVNGDSEQTYGTTSNATATINVSGLIIKLNRTKDKTVIFSGKDKISDVQILAAGTYRYTAYFEGNENYTADSESFTLKIHKAPVHLHLWLNDKEQDLSITYGTKINATATSDEALDIGLKRNGLLIGENHIVSDIDVLATGVYTYTAYFGGNENYTSATLTRTLTIEKAKPKITLYLDGKIWSSEASRTYPAQVYVNATIDAPELQNKVVLKRNGNIVSNPDVSSLDAGVYVYTAEFGGNENYTSCSADQTLIINKADNPVKLLINDQAGDLTIYYGTYINVTGTSAGGKLVLTRNGLDVSSELNEKVLLDAGVYVYKLTALGDKNFKDNSTGISYTVNVKKVPVSISLYIDQKESNQTVERGAQVNITALLNMSGEVYLYIDGNQVAQGHTRVEYHFDTSSAELKAYEIKAVSPESKNQFRAEKKFWITIQDTKAPLITIEKPENKTYHQNWILVKITANEELKSATVKLDGSFTQALSGSGKVWSTTLTNLQIGAHYVEVTAVDTAGNSNTSEKVYFTIPKLSHIVNSTVDGVYYGDVWANIYTSTSTIANSEIKDSTITNSTIIDSKVTAKSISHMVIVGSILDPADFTGSSIQYSNITENDENYIRYSNVTNSTIIYSDIEYSEITLSHIENSTIKNMKIGSANITNDFLYSGWLHFNGVNYTEPTNISNIYDQDTEAPLISKIEISNSAPNPGDMIFVYITAIDNVAVKDVTLNGTAAVRIELFKWNSSLTIPKRDGEYTIPIVVQDYSGNKATKFLGIIVNSSRTPKVILDLDTPKVSAVSPTSAMQGKITFTVTVTDSSEIVSCWLFVDGKNSTQMNYTNGTARGAISLAAGQYELYAICYDRWGNAGEGPKTTVKITAPTPVGGGGGAGGGGFYSYKPLKSELKLTAPEAVSIVPGKTASFQIVLENTGESSLENIAIDMLGLPKSWFILNSKISKLTPGESITNIITISVPETEPIGSRSMTIKITTKEGVSETKTITLHITPPKPQQTNVTSTQPVTQPSVQPPTPSGITALFTAVSDPTAIGILGAAAIIAFAIVWREKRKIKVQKPEKVERKFI